MTNSPPVNERVGRFPVAASVASLATAMLAAGVAEAAVTDTNSSDVLETISVTAQKRTEDVKDVPISISVFSGEQLQAHQISSLDDIARSVPDLAITGIGNTGNTGMANYAIRGVSSTSGPSTVGQQTVGVYLDDVSMSTPTGATVGATALKFFDVNHVEVLRGPQGTLYGASSMGGTIRFVSNEPNLLTLGGTSLATVSGTDHGGLNYVAQGVVNAPLITDTLALRVGGQITRDSGYITENDPFTGTSTPHFNEENSGVIRTSLKYVSQDGSLYILPAVYLQRVNAYGPNTFIPGTHFSADYYVPQVSRDDVFIPSLTIQKDFGWASITSASNYFSRNYTGTIDGTANLEQPAFGFAWPTPFQLPTKVTQVAEELRLTSKSMQESGLPISWIAGTYAASNHTTLGNFLNIAGDYSAFQQQLINALGADAASAISTFGTNLYSQVSHARITQYSGFGEFSYSPVKPLVATAGVRYLVAHETADNASDGFYNGGPSSYSQKTNSHAVTPKIALKYSIDDSTSVYGNVVKGFRLGGTNLPVPTDPTTGVGAGCQADLQAIGLSAAPLSYQPDSIWSYELGAKSSLFGNRVAVDAAAFHIKWSQVQQDILLQAPQTCGFDFVANVGQAKSDGVDYEVRAKVTSQLTTTLAGNVTHAIITHSVAGTGASDGSWLNGVPRWTLSAGADYSLPISTVPTVFTVDGHWVGPSHLGFDPTSPIFNQPEYFVLDASVGAQFDQWRLSLFGKNVLNQNKTIQRVTNAPYYGMTVRPLTVGISLDTSF
jgi:iron complex outermembrane receptor protein